MNKLAMALLLALMVPGVARAATLSWHQVVLDGEGKLAPWGAYDSLYDHVITSSWGLLKSVPRQPNGLKTYFTYPRFVGDSGRDFLSGVWWAHNPAGLFAMLTDSALPYYAYSGDAQVVALAREALDHQLARGTTPRGYSWAGVPYASSDAGSPEYRGGDDSQYCRNHDACGRGDGIGVIEPDKVGELGYQYLRFYELTGEGRYLQAALSCARALALHVRVGDATHSPWPFRVDARTGTRIREEYSANVIGPIRLFDELARLGLGDRKAYAFARATAWKWLMDYPMANNNWSGYFEDIEIHSNPAENPNQYTPLETARYLLERPELDPEWREHVAGILEWVRKVFAADVINAEGVPEAGTQYGAEVVSEQQDDLDKMSSHTARFASLLALWYEKTGETGAKARAWRSFNWAAYFCREDGLVRSSVDEGTGFWFSDGYGDYMRHFLSGMASVPEWAPVRSDHLLRSTSVVREVRYEKARVSYVTFDRASTELLKLSARPVAVQAGGQTLGERADLSLPGFKVEALAAGGFAVTIRHARSGHVDVWTAARGRRSD